MGPKLAYEVVRRCLPIFGHGGCDRGVMKMRLRDVQGFEIGGGTAQIMKTSWRGTGALACLDTFQ